MKKAPLLIASLALALAACNSTATPGTNNASSSASSQQAAAGKRMPMEWVSMQTGTGADGIPQNQLSLQVVGSEEKLFNILCNGVPSTNVENVDGSVATVQCWWAGGGDQYGVFVGDAEQLTVRHRTVDEEAGFGTWEDVAAR